MVGYKNYVIGFITIILASSAYFIITLNDNGLMINIDKTKSTFSINQSGNLIIAGVEQNYLYNGTKSVPKTYTYSIQNDVSGNNIEVRRIINYSKTILTDYYSFDASKSEAESFPISHKICVLNGQGLTLMYQVSKLSYDYGSRNAVSPERFGNNMKVEFQDGYSSAKVSKLLSGGRLQVKYLIKSDNECFDVRLFDPPFVLKGDDVYANDSTQHILVNPAYVTNTLSTMNFQSKVLSGQFKIAIGTNNTPTNYFNVTGIKFITYHNITDINGTNYMLRNITDYPIVKYNLDIKGDNTWFEVQNINIVQNQMYDIEIHNIHNGSGKYDIIGYMNSRTLNWALSNNQYIMLDPWYNVTTGISSPDLGLEVDLKNYYTLDYNVSNIIVDEIATKNATHNWTSNPIYTGKINGGFNCSFGGFNASETMEPIAGSATFSFWAKKTGTLSSSNSAFIWGVGVSSSLWGFSWYESTFRGGKIIYNFRDMDGTEMGGGETSTGLLLNNTWYHLVFMWDKTNLNGSIYVNGRLNVSNTTFAGGSGGMGVINTTMTVFCFQGSQFKGMIDEVGFWNRTLSQTEITNLYNNGDGLSYRNYSDAVITINESVNISLMSPANNTFSNNITQAFRFNYTTNKPTNPINCTLWMNSTFNAGTNTTCTNNTVLSLTNNASLAYNTTYLWFINITTSEGSYKSLIYNYTTNVTPSKLNLTINMSINGLGRDITSEVGSNLSLWANITQNSTVCFDSNHPSYGTNFSCGQNQTNTSFRPTFFRKTTFDDGTNIKNITYHNDMVTNSTQQLYPANSTTGLIASINCINCSFFMDDNWGTYAISNGTTDTWVYWYENWTIDNNADDVNWFIGVSNPILISNTNLMSVSNCYDGTYTTIQTVVGLRNRSSGNPQWSAYCKMPNNTGYSTVVGATTCAAGSCNRYWESNMTEIYNHTLDVLKINSHQYDAVYNLSFNISDKTTSPDRITNFRIYMNSTLIYTFQQISNVILTFSDGSLNKTSNFNNPSLTNTVGYISLPKNMNVSNMSMNITGINLSTTKGMCYQETATTSTLCGGLSSGSSVYTGTWNFGYWLPIDGVWTTSAYPLDGNTWIYINYSKPYGSANTSIWQVKDTPISGGNITNVSITSECWNAFTDRIVFRFGNGTVTKQTQWMCYNGTSWKILRDATLVGSAVYEEAMWWNITLDGSTRPNQTWMEIGTIDGTREWNNTLEYNVSTKVFPNITVVNNYIASSDCTGQSGLNCLIPIYAYSYNPGSLLFMDINVTLSGNTYTNPLTINSTIIQNYIGAQSNTTTIPIIFTSDTNGTVEISDIKYDYLGGNNTYWVRAHAYDYSVNVTYNITYFYSRWDYVMPSTTYDTLEFIPRTPTSKNVSPYGQRSNTPIFNITNVAYSGIVSNYSIYLNESYSCVNLSYGLNGSLGKNYVPLYNYSICYQESANVSTLCGGLDTGNYYSYGSFNNIGYAYDSDWNTGTSTSGAGLHEIYFNYTLLNNYTINNALWEIKFVRQPGNTNVISNISIPQSCIKDEIELKYYVTVTCSSTDIEYFSCYNSSNEWRTLYTFNNGVEQHCGGNVLTFNEEAMNWNISSIIGYNSTPIINNTWINITNNIGYLNKTQLWLYADYGCNSTTWQLWNPQLAFRQCCSGCDVCDSTVN